MLTIAVHSGDYLVEITDMSGVTYQVLSIVGSETIDISLLPAGMFFIEITDNNTGTTLLTNIIKQ